MNIPLTVISPPPPQAGEYWDALERWGALPDKMPVPDVALYLGHLTKQNPHAILRVLSDAIENDGIRFWGQSGDGWREHMIRYVYPFLDKPRLRQDSTGMKWSARLDKEKGELHVEAMAVNPRDAVELLVKRGRKIPDELRHLLAAESTEEAPAEHQVESPGGTKWTAERIAEARAMRDRLKTEKVSDYAAQTAKHYGVSAPRLREVLTDSDKQGSPPATLWASKVHRAR